MYRLSVHLDPLRCAVKALVLGARGAVGTVVVDELRRRGHDVTEAGRRARTELVKIDLAAPDGMTALRRAGDAHDVVVNTSGVEDPKIAGALDGAVLVDISATGAYLDSLARSAEPGVGIVLGAGLVPGLSTILLASLRARAGDEVDLGVVLGGGERHGPAAVAWTADLAGRAIFAAPEPHAVLNFRESRRLPGPHGTRRYLRADFPDHLLLGEPGGYAVRSFLATDSRISTAALAWVGKFPALRGVVQHAPHLGGTGWSLFARNRSNGETRAAAGDGQSHTTGLLTALIAEAAAQHRPTGPVPASRLLSLDEIKTELPEIELEVEPYCSGRRPVEGSAPC